MNKLKFEPKLENFIPINKTLNQNQIHKDYTHSFQNVGSYIASNTPRQENDLIMEKYVSFAASATKSNAIQKALEERKINKSASTSELFPRESLCYSKKPRIIKFTPYTSRDYRYLETPVVLGGLGSWRIGTNEWEIEKEKLDRGKRYSKMVKAKYYKQT
jgi:hypothetical protein